MNLRRRFTSVSVDTGKYIEFVNRIIEMAGEQSSYTCVANAHMVVEAQLNKYYADVVNNANLITPDGVPLKWGLSLIYGIDQERVSGMDLLPDLLKEAERRFIPVYFYGGTVQMLRLLNESILQKYPLLRIAGMLSPPFRDLLDDEIEETADIINYSGAKLVFVCLGCPKQELWMGLMKDRVNATMIGIGGALPVLLGLRERAPLWMQNGGLEWIYRLGQEPKRLIKRYTVTNSIFICLLFMEIIKVKVLRMKLVQN